MAKETFLVFIVILFLVLVCRLPWFSQVFGSIPDFARGKVLDNVNIVVNASLTGVLITIAESTMFGFHVFCCYSIVIFPLVS